MKHKQFYTQMFKNEHIIFCLEIKNHTWLIVLRTKNDFKIFF